MYIRTTTNSSLTSKVPQGPSVTIVQILLGNWAYAQAGIIINYNLTSELVVIPSGIQDRTQPQTSLLYITTWTNMTCIHLGKRVASQYLAFIDILVHGEESCCGRK